MTRRCAAVSLALATGIACHSASKRDSEPAPEAQAPQPGAAPESKEPTNPSHVAAGDKKSEDPSEKPEAADREPSPPATEKTPASVFGQSEADAVRLAKDFCHRGGDLFAPPTGKPYPKPDDWEYQQGDPLSSCDEVHTSTLGTWKTDDASATLTELEVIVEDADGYGPGPVALQHVVTIRSPAGVADHVVTLYGISSFEEASDVTMELDLESAVFRDLLGKGQPDFLIHREEEVGGNFEGDRCLNTTTTSKSATICGDHPSAPGCIDIPIALNEVSVPWSDLSECDEKISRSDRTPRGYKLRYKLPAKDKFVAKWVSKKKKKTSYHGPPKFEGSWSLDDLFGTTEPERRDLLRQWSASDTVVVP